MSAFDTVLVANRGEIAVRIIRSLREMGLRSVAVHSEADAEALHVRLADRSVAIGPARAAESYLSFDRVLGAARDSGAGAVHPGYGFLAENAEFAEACADAGIVFIGPPPAAIRAMGDKARARTLAESCGVPVTPGTPGVADDEIAAAAARIGYPVLLKPAAGGGGKGMTAVLAPEDLEESVQTARRVSRAAFGDDTLIVEKLVSPARHVEIQIFGGADGRPVALGERECSLQRRHQKVVEECPSPAVEPELRARMERAALALAEAVDYRGAGTVEFLLGPDGSFYFLEMNTRLQVEHPVTEAVYGVDLVRAQVLTALGEGLPEELRNARPRGWAMEARLYAEDADRGFLPTPGPLLALVPPVGPGIRFDAAFDGPGVVGADYDPMIAKVISWAADREQARRRLVRALRSMAVLGVTTNAGFLVDLLEHPRVVAGETGIHDLEAWIAAGELGRPPEKPPAAVLAAAGRAFETGGRRSAAAAGEPVADPFDRLGAWRLGAGGAR